MALIIKKLDFFKKRDIILSDKNDTTQIYDELFFARLNLVHHYN